MKKPIYQRPPIIALTPRPLAGDRILSGTCVRGAATTKVYMLFAETLDALPRFVMRVSPLIEFLQTLRMRQKVFP